MPKTAHQESYSTSSIWEAAYLYANGFTLAGKVDAGPKKILIFEGSGAKQASIDFYNDKPLGARTFSDAYRTIKDFVFQR